MIEKQIHIETKLQGSTFSSKDDENLVKDFLANKELDARRFEKTEKSNGPTPDFRVFDKSNSLVFYCEVKSIVEDEWLDRQLDQAPPLTIVGGARDDPTYNKISNKIHEAVAQFNSVNPKLTVPNILIFVNHEDMCDAGDLYSVITGCFLTNQGGKHPIYRQFSEGRIKKEKERIHLYVWFEDAKARHFHFGSQDQNKKRLLYDLLKLEEEKIREIL